MFIFDARKLRDFGIGTYIEVLLNGFYENKLDFEVIALKKDKKFISEKLNFFEERKIHYTNFKNYSPFEHFFVSSIVNKKDYSFYFSPHYVFPYFIKKKLYVTVHDLIHFILPYYPEWKLFFAKKFIRKVKEKAEIVFTVSHKTKEDLVELFSFAQEKIVTIKNGIDDLFLKKTLNFGKRDNFILYVGDWRKPHKNFKTIVSAILLLKKEFGDVKLKVIGAIPDKRNVQELKNKGIYESIEFLGFKSKEELITYYDKAKVFAFPSLYEGFGYPPLEALSRGVNVISSRCGSLEENLKGYSEFLDNPEDPEELSIKIKNMLEKEVHKEEIIKKNNYVRENFSQEQMVKNYLKFLDV